MTPQPHRRMEHCKDASVVIKGDGVAWIKCDKVVGDCLWVIANGKCPNKSRPAPSAPTDEQCRICSEAIRKDEREKVLEQFAIRVRREFAQDDDEEWYLSSYDFEDCLEELKNDE